MNNKNIGVKSSPQSGFNNRLITGTSALATAVAIAIHGYSLPARAETWISVEAQQQWLDGDSQIWTEASPNGVISNGIFKIRPDEGQAWKIGFGTPIKQGLSAAFFARVGSSENEKESASANSLYNVLGGNFTAGYRAGSVTHDEHHEVVDFEVRKDVGIGGHEGLIKGGVRYARFDADTDTTFSGLYPIFALSEDRNTSFSGIGPRIGLNLSFPIAQQWNIDFSGSASYLWGERKRRINTVGGRARISNEINESNDDQAWNMEASIALTYSVMDNLQLSAGVRGEKWTDVFDQRRTYAFNGDFGNESADRNYWNAFLRLKYTLDSR